MRHVTLIVLTLLLVAAGRSDEPAFKSGRASDARTAYERDIKRAEDEFNTKVLKAAKTYSDVLRTAKNSATRAGDLNQANALRTELSDFDTTGRRAGGELVTLRAKWGSGGSWTDMTNAVRTATHDRGLFPLGQLPDPAWGKFKTLIIEGTYGGRPFMYYYDAQAPARNFYFGKPIPLPPK